MKGIDLEQTLTVKEILDYCEKCADVVQKLHMGVLDKIGHGESETSAIGAMAYFMQQETMLRYEIPRAIYGLVEEKRKEEDKP